MRYLLAGFVLAAALLSHSAVTARENPLPFNVGDTISFRYDSSARDCKVLAVKGQFVQCKEHEWRNLHAVELIVTER